MTDIEQQLYMAALYLDHDKVDALLDEHKDWKISPGSSLVAMTIHNGLTQSFIKFEKRFDGSNADSAMNIAIERGHHADVFVKMLSKHVDLHYQDFCYLKKSIVAEQPEPVEFLVPNGDDREEAMTTGIELATAFNYPKMVEAFVRLGDIPDCTKPLITATAHNMVEIVNLLIPYADVCKVVDTMKENDKGSSPDDPRAFSESFHKLDALAQKIRLMGRAEPQTHLPRAGL